MYVILLYLTLFIYLSSYCSSIFPVIFFFKFRLIHFLPTSSSLYHVNLHFNSELNLGEILEWWGWFLINPTPASLWFAAFSTIFLGARAVKTHSFYTTKFDNYPRNRKALIPFLMWEMKLKVYKSHSRSSSCQSQICIYHLFLYIIFF